MVELQRRSEMRLLEAARHFFDEAAERLGLEYSLRELLRYPKRQLAVTFPVTLDDGTTQHFEGYRAQHHPVLGPCKGGVRFHPAVTLEEVEALAILMSWKAAIMGLPFSGSKGGVRCNPKTLSVRELERLTRRYAAEIAPLIDPDADIPGPDLYTNEREMAWIVDTLSMHRRGQFIPGLVTGKPKVLGGSEGRESATGRGGFFGALEAMRYLGQSFEKARIVIQGFGNVGWNFAHFAHEAGARIVAVSDSQGGVYNPTGLDLIALKRHKERTGVISDFAPAENLTNAELLELPCEILVPAAVEQQITAHNAARVHAQVIVELANGPMTQEADQILYERGVFVVPDVLANAGGVTVSYFEWTQDRSLYFLGARKVDRLLREYITRGFERVWTTHQREGINMRTAAYIVAVDRVATAARARGLYA